MNKKKANYMKLVRTLITNDRKILFISTLSMIIGFTFLFTVTSLSDTIIKTKQEDTVKTYGKFLAVVPNISKEDENEIKKQYSQFDFEHFNMAGEVEYKDNKIAIGTMEERMGDTLAFRLIKGNWPRTSGQIAVEEYLLSLFGVEDERLPVRITLQREGKSVEYEITGVVSNYSYHLRTSTDARADERIYPSIICAEAAKEDMKTSLVILQKKLNFKESNADMMTLWDIQLDNVCDNVDLYEQGYSENEDTIHLRAVYLVLLNFLLLLEQIVMLRAFLLRNKKTLSLFEALGLSPKGKRKVIFYLVQAYTWFSLIIGYLLAALVGFTYMKHTFGEYNEFYMYGLNHSVLAEALIAGVVLLCLYFFYGSNRKGSIIKELIGDAFNKENDSKRQRKYRFKKLNGSVIIIQTVCIFFTMFSFYVMNNFQEESGDIEISILSRAELSAYQLNGYRIAAYKDNGFSLDALDSFREYQDYLRLSADAETKMSTLLLKKDNIDSYFRQYCEEEEDEPEPEERRQKDEALWGQVSDKAEQYQPISVIDLQIVVMPQKDFHDFLKENGIQNPDLEQNAEKACVLRLPGYKQTQNPSIRENDVIELGGIRGNDEAKIRFYTESFKVEVMLSCDEEECSYIQVVMSEETAWKSKTIAGYNSISIVMDRDTPAAIQKDVEQKALLLAASKQGSGMGTSGEDNQRSRLYRNLGSVMCNTMLIFCIIAIGIYIIFSTYIDWEKYSHEYGVLRSFGMSYSTLQNKLFIRYSNSIIIACVISMILGKHTFLDSDMSRWQILVSIGITVGATCLCGIGVFYWKKKESISSMLNKG